MSLHPGLRVGPYDVVAPLGAGAMGEVFRAHDTRLKRDVALKVLPLTAVSDSDRRSRFDREAQVLASLNHPNIAQVFGVEENDGTRTVQVTTDGGLNPMWPPGGREIRRTGDLQRRNRRTRGASVLSVIARMLTPCPPWLYRLA
ncbi:MAG: protein kinase [Acidobacteria bacterium]|nr:protein kinase [Acidobacteriota bacterium]